MGQFFSKTKKLFEKRKEEQSKQSLSNPLFNSTDESGNPVAEDSKLLDGRQFKKSGSPIYPLPNDQSEFNRLNIQHYIFQYTFQGNYRSPVTKDLERGIKVLDVGCGTGLWSIASILELAKQFPNSSFTGTDIANVFSGAAETAPPNVNFLEADTIKGLPFDDNTFDFVFQRAQVLCYKVTDWPIALKELVRVCKPGGYMESFEVVLPQDSLGPALKQHTEWFRTFIELRGVSDKVFLDDNLFSNAGWSEIDTLIQIWPLGWGEDIKLGELSSKNYATVIAATRPQITTALGIGEAEYTEVADAAIKELTNPTGIQPYLTYCVRFGRKALQN